MLYLAERGYRVIAFDRRGHGRSDQPWSGYLYDQFADDLRDLIEQLGLSGVTLVGHSIGGGEIARYVRRHGTKRVRKMVFVSSATPRMLKTDVNPGGLPIAMFDHLRSELVQDRAQFYWQLSVPYFGYNLADRQLGQALRRQFLRIGLQSSVKAALDCMAGFFQEDFTSDMQSIDVPSLFLHGQDDQIVPVQNSSVLSSEIVREAMLRIVCDGSHGLPITHSNVVNQELLTFLQKA